MQHSRKKLELTGQRFRNLMVLAPAENIRNRTAWLCRCDCGKEIVVTARSLRGGRTVSCGCSQRGLSSLNFVDGTCVEWIPRKGSWQATICFKGKRHNLDSYKRFEDAVQARRQGEQEFFDPFLREFEERTRLQG